jgi:hypothetical protein
LNRVEGEHRAAHRGGELADRLAGRARQDPGLDLSGDLVGQGDDGFGQPAGVPDRDLAAAQHRERGGQSGDQFGGLEQFRPGGDRCDPQGAGDVFADPLLVVFGIESLAGVVGGQRVQQHLFLRVDLRAGPL